MHWPTNLQLENKIIGQHKVELFVLPPRDHPSKYAPVPRWSVASGPGSLFFVPSLSVFTYYSGLMLRASKADKGKSWRISVTEVLMFWCDIVVAAHEAVLISKSADPRMVEEACACWC